MLPSLQESLDGDDKELESSEEGGSAEERRLEPPPSRHYCLYSYRGSRLTQHRGESDDGRSSSTNAETPSGDDFSLSLLDTNLPSEVEPELRSFIAKRLSKGAFFEGLGNVASVELRIPGYRVGCYYCLFQQDKLLPETAAMGSEHNPSEYVVCFLGGSEKGLELFRLELDKYIQGLKNNMNCELTGLSVSNGKDQLVVFHTKDNKDLIVCLFSKQPTHESRIGELVGVLVNHFKSEKRHLQVNVTNPVQCSLHGKKCTVSVETRLNQPQPDFTKNRSGFILSVPGN